MNFPLVFLKTKVLGYLILLLVLLLSSLFLYSDVLASSTFTVNTNQDGSDANHGNGVCETATGNGICTLRAAIEEANSLSGEDTVTLPAQPPSFVHYYNINGQIEIEEDVNILGFGYDTTGILGSGNGRIFDIPENVIVHLSDLSINNGRVATSGSGVIEGGGIRNLGTLLLNNVYFHGNTTGYGFSGETRGGGLYNSGTATLNRVFFDTNSSSYGGGGTSFGGGVFNSGSITITNSIFGVNSTFTGGGGMERGGGLYNSGTAVLTNVSFRANYTNVNTAGEPTSGGEDIYNEASGTVSIKNTLLYDASNLGVSTCVGDIDSLGNNLVSNTTCGFNSSLGDILSANFGLGPEGGYVGFPPYLTPQFDSPAIDNGNNDGCPSTDQRGLPRPKDGDGDEVESCDIGAYELQAPYPALTDLSPVKVWVGLKNSDDVGTKFDLLAEVYKDTTLVTSGQVNSVGGGAGFNNAILDTIPLNSFSPIDFPSGSALKVKVYVRNACTGSGHNSGFARLWFNDSAANSRLGSTIGGTAVTDYLLDGFALSTTVGGGPKKTIDVQSGAKCSAFKTFGTWTITP